MSKIDEAISKLNDQAIQQRLRSSIRQTTLGELKKEGIDLSPAEWGEVTAKLLSAKDAGDVLAGAASVIIGLGFSDRRLKTNVIDIGARQNGIKLYEFSYLGFRSRWIGVIAQEIQEICPSAVHQDKSGFLSVDYAQLGIVPRPAR